MYVSEFESEEDLFVTNEHNMNEQLSWIEVILIQEHYVLNIPQNEFFFFNQASI